MKTRWIFLVVFVSAMVVSFAPACAQLLFEDGFESADMSTTNGDGFSWGKNNRTSIVIQDPTDGPVAVWNNGPIYSIKDPIMEDGSVRDWTAYKGRRSLRFRYHNRNRGLEPWSEQRFDLGGTYSDLWFSYQLRVPINYVQENAAQSIDNGKLFSLWMDKYAGGSGADGPAFVWGSRPDGQGGSTASIIYAKADTSSLGEFDSQPFISVPQDRGRWMKVVINVRAASVTDGISDENGRISIWRQWAGETDFTQLSRLENIDLAPSSTGPGGWEAGYLMGWQNNGYPVNTEWLLDDFKISQSSLLVPEPCSLGLLTLGFTTVAGCCRYRVR